jgi:hypothetical protein
MCADLLTQLEECTAKDDEGQLRSGFKIHSFYAANSSPMGLGVEMDPVQGENEEKEEDASEGDDNCDKGDDSDGDKQV